MEEMEWENIIIVSKTFLKGKKKVSDSLIIVLRDLLQGKELFQLSQIPFHILTKTQTHGQLLVLYFWL